MSEPGGSGERGTKTETNQRVGGGEGEGVVEGDETGSEEGVKDEGRRTEEPFKQKQRGEFPQSSSRVLFICTFSSSSSCSGASEPRRQSLRSGPDVAQPSLCGHGSVLLPCLVLGFIFVIVKSKI